MTKKIKKKKLTALDKFLKKNTIKGKFIPYAYYDEKNKNMKVYFKDEAYFVQRVNDNLELIISFETKDVIGVNVLNVDKIVVP